MVWGCHSPAGTTGGVTRVGELWEQPPWGDIGTRSPVKAALPWHSLPRASVSPAGLGVPAEGPASRVAACPRVPTPAPWRCMPGAPPAPSLLFGCGFRTLLCTTAGLLEGGQARSHSSRWNLPSPTPPDLSRFGNNPRARPPLDTPWGWGPLLQPPPVPPGCWGSSCRLLSAAGKGGGDRMGPAVPKAAGVTGTLGQASSPTAGCVSPHSAGKRSPPGHRQLCQPRRAARVALPAGTCLSPGLLPWDSAGTHRG